MPDIDPDRATPILSWKESIQVVLLTFLLVFGVGAILATIIRKCYEYWYYWSFT